MADHEEGFEAYALTPAASAFAGTAGTDFRKDRGAGLHEPASCGTLRIMFPRSDEERLLAQVLRGEPLAWPPRQDEDVVVRRLLELCEQDGLIPLLHHHLRATPEWAAWPAAVHDKLARATRIVAAVDMLREVELVAVLAALADAGVEGLLLKGAALAYTHYRDPALRSRSDTDLLIAVRDRAVTTATLEALGYRRPNAVSGRFVSYEEYFTRSIGQLDHVVDLHWQVNNMPVFANSLAYEEMRARAVAVPQLGPHARTLYPPHALLLACMHRAGHRAIDGPEVERRIWLYDIHLLATAMSATEWREFIEQCVAKEMREICIDALEAARHAYGTAYPAGLFEALSHSGKRELSANFLEADQNAALRLALRALPKWRDRAALIKEMLFPPSAYVLGKYGVQGRWRLPWLYLRRAVEGVRKRRRR